MSDQTNDQTTVLFVVEQVALQLADQMVKNKEHGGLGNAVLLEGEVIEYVLTALGIESPNGDELQTNVRHLAETLYRQSTPPKKQTPNLTVI